ncbi:MAG: hypothetical protein HY235_29370 [Acidobacteria bacterium]|nr:hypothetical protein [Acidobacteriota bacterium]
MRATALALVASFSAPAALLRIEVRGSLLERDIPELLKAATACWHWSMR